MTIERGFTLAGLLGGLLDSPSSTELSAAIREVLAFAQADHEWTVTVRHNPPEDDS